VVVRLDHRGLFVCNIEGVKVQEIGNPRVSEVCLVVLVFVVVHLAVLECKLEYYAGGGTVEANRSQCETGRELEVVLYMLVSDVLYRWEVGVDGLIWRV